MVRDVGLLLLVLLALVLIPMMGISCRICMGRKMGRLDLSPAVIHDESSAVSGQLNVSTLGLEGDHESVRGWEPG